MRLLQGVGGAMLMANSGAILTDAFPPSQRGLALGLNQVAGIAGSFIGLVLGGGHTMGWTSPLVIGLIGGGCCGWISSTGSSRASSCSTESAWDCSLHRTGPGS